MVRHERALSDMVALILIAFLVILVALFILAALTGVLSGFLQKTALIAVTASEIETGSGNHIIRLYHKQGDAVNLNGTSQTGGSAEITIILTTPSESVILHPIGTMEHDAWSPGNRLYIYPDSGSYGFKDALSAPPPALTPGDYTIRITDTKAKVLLHTLTVTIT